MCQRNPSSAPVTVSSNPATNNCGSLDPGLVVVSRTPAIATAMIAATPPLTMVNVVDQDEFNRDVVIELPASCELVGPGGPRLFLVYDCT